MIGFRYPRETFLDVSSPFSYPSILVSLLRPIRSRGIHSLSWSNSSEPGSLRFDRIYLDTYTTGATTKIVPLGDNPSLALNCGSYGSGICIRVRMVYADRIIIRFSIMVKDKGVHLNVVAFAHE